MWRSPEKKILAARTGMMAIIGGRSGWRSGSLFNGTGVRSSADVARFAALRRFGVLMAVRQAGSAVSLRAQS
jgi:hypothetical protein